MNLMQMIFPLRFYEKMERVLNCIEKIQEIRIRVNQCIFVRTQYEDYRIGKAGQVYQGKKIDTYSENPNEIFLSEDIQQILNHLLRNSKYAYQEEIKNGFITLEGGHRVGIAGQVVLDEEGGIKTIKDIVFLHIRIAHDVKGIAKELIGDIYNDGYVKNCLIISPPGFGKTTLLRDIVRELSDGTQGRGYKQCCLIDERGELAGVYQGIPQMDVGKHTDVYSECPKTIGMLMAIRAMGPEVIGIDELGGKEDVEALRYAMRCGCSVMATIHGTSVEDIKKKEYLQTLICENMFQMYIVIQNYKHEYKVYTGV